MLNREPSEKNNEPNLAFLIISIIFVAHINSYIND